MSSAPVRRTKEEMRPYQKRGARFVLTRKYCALFIDMGLGKTIIMLTAIVRLLKLGKIESVLIVAPLRVVYTVWRQEAKLWQHTRGLQFSLVHGSHTAKVRALNKPAHVYLTNVENLKWLDEVYGKRKAWPFDMLVVDESSMFKKVKTVRFGIMRRRARDFTRRVVMTGTPTPNGLYELWPQLFIADRGYHLGQRYTDFKARYFNKGGYMGYKLIVKDEALEEVTAASSPIVMRLDSADWLDLPKLIDVPVWVDMPKEAREQYEELEREMFLAFDETGTFVDNPNAASLRNRCCQIAGGAIYAEHEDTAAKVWQPMHTAKLDAFGEIYEELQGENLFGLYGFRHELLRLRRQHKDFSVIAGAKDGVKQTDVEKIVLDWNKKKLPGILAHPASVGHGLNLQYGGRHFAWFTLTDSLELYLQTIKRLHRSGQDRAVINMMILCRDTYDEVKWNDMQFKNVQQGRVNDAYRAGTMREYMQDKKRRNAATTVEYRDL